MPLRTPPPEVPIVSFLTPNKADQGLLEFWNTEAGDYTPLDIGAPHPNTRQYPGFRLGKQAPLQGDEKWVLRTWVTDETSPDWFNYAIKYSESDSDFPIFVRTYRERKDSYTPLGNGVALGAIYKLVLDDDKRGSGYPSGVLPNVVFDDPAVAPTDVALAHAVVSPDGTIKECVIDFGGTGYLENLRFRVESVGDSNPAEGTAFVQLQAAVLTKEEAQQYPEDSPFYGQYLQVSRIYETLPGPWVYSENVDDDGVHVVTKKRRNIAANIVVREGVFTGNTWEENDKQGDDSFTAEEVNKSRPIVTSDGELAAAEAAGFFLEKSIVDPDGITVTQRRVMASFDYLEGITPRETLSGGVWKVITSEPIDSHRVWYTRDSRTVPGNSITTTKIDEDGKVITESKILADKTTITSSESIIAGVWTRVYQDDPPYFRGFAIKQGDLVAWKVTETRTVPGNPIVWEIFDKNGDKHTMTRTLKDASLITEQQTLVSTTWTSVTSKPVSDLVSWEIKDSMQVPGVQVPFKHTDSTYGIVVTGYKQVVPASTAGGISGGYYNTVNPMDDLRSALVASKIDPATLPSPKTWYSGKVHSFPPVLKMNITGGCPGPLSGDPVIDWAEASCHCSSSFSADLIANMSQFTGEVPTRITEQFYIGPPPNDVTPYQFFPESHNFGFAWASACGSSDGSCITKSGAPHFRIPLCLHPDVTFCIGTAATWFFAATTPSALPSGDYIMLSPHIEERTFGLFRRVLTEVLVP